MKIAVVTPSPSSGAETPFANLSAHLSNSGEVCYSFYSLDADLAVSTPNELRPALLRTCLLRDRPDIVFLPQQTKTGRAERAAFADFPARLCVLCDGSLPDEPLEKQARIEFLRRADFLFATTKSVAGEIAALNIVPHKIFTVGASVPLTFTPLSPEETQTAQAWAWAQGITRPYVLGVESADGKNNALALIKAFSEIPITTRSRFQLVIAAGENQTGYESLTPQLAMQAALHNLEAESVVFLTATPPQMRTLYGLCRLFAAPPVPSLALPLVCALACNAAVIVGRDPALTEIVPDADQHFDEVSFSAQMEAVLTDEARREAFVARAARHAAPLTMGAAAHKITAIFAQIAAASLAPVPETLDLRRAEETRAAGAKPHIAFWSPFRPLQSGISDYSEEILPALSRHYAIDLIVDDDYAPLVDTPTPLPVFRHKMFPTLLERRRNYYTSVYQVGNSPFHYYQFAALLRYAGITVLHDYNLSGMVASLSASLSQEFPYALLQTEISEQYGVEKAEQVIRDLASGNYQAADLPARDIYTNRRVFARSLGVALHSPWAYEKAVAEHGDLCPHIALIPPVMPAVPLDDTLETVRRLREKWGVPPDAFVFAPCGIIAETKRVVPILDAFKTHLTSHPDAFLLFVGSEGTPFDFQKEIKKRGIERRVKITGYVPVPRFNECLRVSDVCITLRYPSNGETSGALLRMLVHGKPSIVTAIGSFDDFPTSTVHKLAPPLAGNAAEVAEIAAAMRLLQTDAGYRTALGKAGADFIHREHSPERCARLYADFLQTVMGDPQTRTKLLADWAGREAAKIAAADAAAGSTNARDANARDANAWLAPFAAIMAASR